jgi:CBS domain-containing protein
MNVIEGKVKSVFLEGVHADNLMEKDIPYYYSDTIGLTLVTAMINRSWGAIPIVDEEKRLMGIVTEFDLLNALIRGKNLETVRAAEIMALEPKFVKEDTSAEAIIKIMDALHLIHLPVVNKDGQLVGLIERSNILLSYLEHKRSPLQF